MINYYTKFIGLDGDIEKEDTLIPEDRTKLEKEIEKYKELSKKTQKEVDEIKKNIHELIRQEIEKNSSKKAVKHRLVN